MIPGPEEYSTRGGWGIGRPSPPLLGSGGKKGMDLWDRPYFHPGILEGVWWRKEVRGMENREVTSDGFNIGFSVLSVTRRTTLFVSCSS